MVDGETVEDVDDLGWNEAELEDLFVNANGGDRSEDSGEDSSGDSGEGTSHHSEDSQFEVDVGCGSLDSTQDTTLDSESKNFNEMHTEGTIMVISKGHSIANAGC
ncbi:hypothetical protein M5689_011665 [Euphorbia peplus]|nr:hypothetical protein M5689_011665 [Euphorbia peplus]